VNCAASDREGLTNSFLVFFLIHFFPHLTHSLTLDRSKAEKEKYHYTRLSSSTRLELPYPKWKYFHFREYFNWSQTLFVCKNISQNFFQRNSRCDSALNIFIISSGSCSFDVATRDPRHSSNHLISHLHMYGRCFFMFLRDYWRCWKKIFPFSLAHITHNIQNSTLQHFNAINYSTKIIQTSFFLNSNGKILNIFAAAVARFLIAFSMYLWKINWRRFV
jgi:hypothetical protein